MQAGNLRKRVTLQQRSSAVEPTYGQQLLGWTDSGGVAAVVAARIYPAKLPQNTPMPAIAYEYVSGMEMAPIDAAAGQQLVRSRVQVNAMGKNYADVKAVQEAIRLALLYQSGVIAGITVLAITRDVIGPDLRDDELALYMQSVDYMVLHYES